LNRWVTPTVQLAIVVANPDRSHLKIDDVVDRGDREKVLLSELPFGVVDNAERRNLPSFIRRAIGFPGALQEK
jgi:hypothetical protein